MEAQRCALRRLVLEIHLIEILVCQFTERISVGLSCHLHNKDSEDSENCAFNSQKSSFRVKTAPSYCSTPQTQGGLIVFLTLYNENSGNKAWSLTRSPAVSSRCAASSPGKSIACL